MRNYCKEKDFKHLEQVEDGVWKMCYLKGAVSDDEKDMFGLDSVEGLVSFEECFETKEPTVRSARKMFIEEIEKYDKSSAVNEFYYQGVPMWLDKDTRNGLVARLQAEKAVGKTSSTLWMGTQSFTVGIDECLQMLTALEVYASACYDKTQEHKAHVMALEDVGEVLAYDYTQGYPEKLEF